MLHKIVANATAGVEKIRIKSTELKPGMFVSELDRPWIDSPFLVHGFTIRDQKMLEQVQAHCEYVYIDIKRGNLASKLGYGEKPKQTVHHQASCSFIENLDSAKSSHAKIKSAVKSFYAQFRDGLPFDVDSVKPTINACVETILANPDSLLWLSMIKHKDDYTAEHSVNVALLSIILGRAEGLDRENLNTLGLCAMLHDVGKVRIPDEILNKEGNLDDNEFAVMRMHTVHGKKLLLGQKGLPSIATEIALSHHEKMDGSGYPGGLSGNEIPYMVKLVAVVDAYDAMTSGRIYCKAMSPAEALRKLLQSKGVHHDSNILESFVDCIGIYPIGSVVELNSGEIAIVLPNDKNNNLQPLVLKVADAAKKPCEPCVVNINHDKRPDNGRPYMIRAIHEDGKYGVHFRDFCDIAIPFIAE